jgi:hypothetical protein
MRSLTTFGAVDIRAARLARNRHSVRKASWSAAPLPSLSAVLGGRNSVGMADVYIRRLTEGTNTVRPLFRRVVESSMLDLRVVDTESK